MRPPARIIASLTAVALLASGCASAPGPMENTQRAVLAACHAGDQMACQQANYLAAEVYAEQQKRQQDNKVATGVLAAVGGGLLVGLAILGR